MFPTEAKKAAALDPEALKAAIGGDRKFISATEVGARLGPPTRGAVLGGAGRERAGGRAGGRKMVPPFCFRRKCFRRRPSRTGSSGASIDGVSWIDGCCLCAAALRSWRRSRRGGG